MRFSLYVIDIYGKIAYLKLQIYGYSCKRQKSYYN